MNKISLSMITFFYNEEEEILEYLKIVTDKFEKIKKNFDYDYEIVLVNDGSTDNSKKIVEKYILENKNISFKLVSYEENKGIGYALIQGLKNCSNDYVFWNDVDLHFNIDDLGKIFNLLNESTIVVTYKINILYKTFIPWFVSRVNYNLLKFLFYRKIKDFQFVQFFPKKFIKNIKIISRSSLIPCELLSRSKGKYNIEQVGLYYTSPSEERKSKCLNFQNIYYTFRDIFKLRIKLWFNK